MYKKINKILMGIVSFATVLTILPLSGFNNKCFKPINTSAVYKIDYTYDVVGDEVSIKKYTGTDTNLKIPDVINGRYVTSIQDYAFADCDSLISVTLPETITTIGIGMFYKCDNLTYVTIPNSITIINERMFASCPKISSITIPDSVVSIGDCAFDSCTNLTSITIPDSVVSIGWLSFYQCTNLSDVKIGNSVKSIANESFYCCNSLLQIEIPKSVTLIGFHAFGISTTKIIDFTIIGYAGSVAETYATANNITFKSIGIMPILGDVTGDSNVNISDLILLKKMILGIEILNESADINKDNKINIFDFNNLKKMLANQK